MRTLVVVRESRMRIQVIAKVWVGVVLFLFGLGSMFYPPLRALIGSVTTSIAISAAGLALIVLPSLVVGNELAILGGVGVCVAIWFVAHRHGSVRGELRARAVTR